MPTSCSARLILSSAPSLPLDHTAHIVPEEMTRAFFGPSFIGLEQLLLHLNEHSAYAAIVIGTPPPKGDLERLCRNVEKEAALKDVARDLGVPAVPASLTATGVMLKLWRLLQAMMAEIAAAAGASFVAVPQRLVTLQGVLSDEHWAANATSSAPPTATSKPYARCFSSCCARAASSRRRRIAGRSTAR
jgi:hypothetical protein